MNDPRVQLSDGIPNPFDTRMRISTYTAQEIATLQSRLDKQLGPEFISSRQGPGGGRVHYLAAEKVINLANEVFGFNGWSTSIQQVQIDFVDENPTTGKVSVGISVIVRVTLRDGAFHEDIGYGQIENCKGKAAAFEKSKKEAVTDALKRTLKNFGNVLGNCLYDKDYLQKVSKLKPKPTGKWSEVNLYRHADYMPVNRESSEAPIPQQISQPSSKLADQRTATTSSATSSNLDDEMLLDVDESEFLVDGMALDDLSVYEQSLMMGDSQPGSNTPNNLDDLYHKRDSGSVGPPPQQQQHQLPPRLQQQPGPVAPPLQQQQKHQHHQLPPHLQQHPGPNAPSPQQQQQQSGQPLSGLSDIQQQQSRPGSIIRQGGPPNQNQQQNGNVPPIQQQQQQQQQPQSGGPRPPQLHQQPPPPRPIPQSRPPTINPNNRQPNSPIPPTVNANITTQTINRGPPPQRLPNDIINNNSNQPNPPQPHNPLRTVAPHTPSVPPILPSIQSELPAPIPMVGFVSSRQAKEVLEHGNETSPIPANIPAYNPSTDSPSLRRTMGLNQNSSRPIMRHEIQAAVQANQTPAVITGGPPTNTNTGNISNNNVNNSNNNNGGQPPPNQNPNQNRAGISNPSPFNPVQPPKGHPANFLNPQTDQHRRIGMPGGNRNAYRSPIPVGGLKRAAPEQMSAPVPRAPMIGTNGGVNGGHNTPPTGGSGGGGNINTNS